MACHLCDTVSINSKKIKVKMSKVAQLWMLTEEEVLMIRLLT